MTLIELCAGSVRDCLIAQEAGLDRIELNSALALGGLTPTVDSLELAKANGVTLPIICMVRPRGVRTRHGHHGTRRHGQAPALPCRRGGV